MSTLPARRFLAAVTMVAFIVATVDSTSRWEGPALKPLSMWAVGIGVFTLCGWFWLAMRIPKGQPATHRNWEVRRSRGARTVFYLGISAVTAIGLSLAWSTPEWIAFSAGDLTVEPLKVSKIGEVTADNRTGYEYTVTAEVVGTDERRTVTQTVVLPTHPRHVEVGALGLYVIYDPANLDLGMFFTDDPDKHSFIQDMPASWMGIVPFAVLIGAFWFFDEWNSRNDRGRTSKITSIVPANMKWTLITFAPLLMTVLVLWALAAATDHSGPPGFNNEMFEDTSIRGVAVMLFVLPPTAATAFFLRYWADINK